MSAISNLGQFPWKLAKFDPESAEIESMVAGFSDQMLAKSGPISANIVGN